MDITNIKLPARLSGHPRISLFPDYVSNGHWAVKRTALKNAGCFATLATVQVYWPKYQVVEKDSDEAIDAINRRIEDPHKLVALRYVETDGGEDYRFFLDTTTHQLAQFNRGYLALFGLDRAGVELWGSTEGACRDTCDADSMTLLLMPRKFDVKGVGVLSQGIEKMVSRERTHG